MPVAAPVAGAVAGAVVTGMFSNRAAKSAQRSEKAMAAEQLALGREQFEWNKQKYERDVAPYVGRASEAQIGSMEENRARASEQWKQYQELFAPTERKMVEFATDYDTPERRAERRATAAATVAGAHDRADEMLGRNLGRLGLRRTSDAMLQSSLARARDTAGAMTKSDRDTELTGAALMEGAAKFGRGLPNTGIAADQLAIAGGNAAVGNQIAGLSARNAAVNSAMPWYAGAMGAQAQYRNQQAGLYGGIGQLAGMALGGSKRPWWLGSETSAPTGTFDSGSGGMAWGDNPEFNKGGLVKRKRKYGTHYRIVQKGYADGGMVGGGKPVMVESVTLVLDNTQSLDPTGHMTEGYSHGGLVRRSKSMPGAQFYAHGGMVRRKKKRGGAGAQFYSHGGLVRGPGTETSDSVPAVIDGEQPAALSDGEGVLNAGAVEIVGEDFIERVNRAGLQRQGREPETIEGEATEVEEE